MTKVQLRHLVEQQQTAALIALRAARDEQRKALLQKFCATSGLNEVTKGVQEHLNQACSALRAWMAVQPDEINDTERFCCTLTSHLREYAMHPDEVLQRIIRENLDHGTRVPGFDAIQREYERNVSECKQQYTAVIAGIKSCPNAKAAAKFLTELGFEVPQDEKKACEALMPLIDTRYLFLAREVKSDATD